VKSYIGVILPIQFKQFRRRVFHTLNKYIKRTGFKGNGYIVVLGYPHSGFIIPG